MQLEDAILPGPGPAVRAANAGSGVETVAQPPEPATPGHVSRLAGDAVVLTLDGELDAVAPVWQALEREASHTFFQTFAWLAAWQRHVGAPGGVVPVIVTARHPDGTLLFILPLAIHRRGALRRLTFLGADLCDYNAPVLHPQFETMVDDRAFAELWPRLLGQLHADRRFRFDLIDLSKMPERVGEQPNPLLVLSTRANPSGAHVTALGGSWDELYASKRSADTRKRERRQLRQLADYGEIRFIDTLEGDERRRTLDLLFEQKAQSFARMGVRDIFARAGYRELFTGFAMAAESRHLVHLSRLEVGPMIAAVSLGFVSGSRYLLVISSYDGGEVARFGPGRAHLHQLLRLAIQNGLSVFDFTIGDEAYKDDWSDARLTLRDHLSAANWRGAIVVAFTSRYRAAKREIKQNPVLWRLFSRARSRFGAFRASRLAKAGLGYATSGQTEATPGQRSGAPLDRHANGGPHD